MMQLTPSAMPITRRPDVDAILALLSVPTPAVDDTGIAAPPPPRSVRCCFVLPDAAALLRPGAQGYFGGAEVRGTTILRALQARPEFDLCAVVKGDRGETATGVDGIPLFFRPDVHYYEGQHDGNDSAYAAANADVYVVFGANEMAAEVARYCRRRGRKLVVSIASDAAFDPEVHEGSTVRDVYGTPKHYIWFGLAHADHLVVQTEEQRTRIAKQFGRSSTLIRNPVPWATRRAPRTAPARTPRVIWIGRMDHNKRPREALQIAAVLTEARITIVMNGWDALPQAERDALQAKRPNTTFVDSLPPDALARTIAEHDVLLNTSSTEGFPNTFLQAGMSAVPVVSMHVDPGGLLGVHGGGVVADNTVVGTVLAMRALLASPARYAACSRALHEYVLAHHDPAQSASAFAEVLVDVARPTGVADDWLIR